MSGLVDLETLSAEDLAHLQYLARERERRWAEVADPWRPTIGAVRARARIRPVSPMGPIRLDRLRRVAASMASWAGYSRSEIVARALLDLAEESGTDLQAASRAIVIGLRQGRGRRTFR